IPHQVVVGPRFGVCVLTGQAQVQLETATVAIGVLLNMCDAERFVLRTPYDRTSLVGDGDRRAPMIGMHPVQISALEQADGVYAQIQILASDSAPRVGLADEATGLI